MFNFTTTTVLNSLKDAQGNPILAYKGAADVEGSADLADDVLIVKWGPTFKKDNVHAIYKKVAEKGVKESVTIDLSGLSESTDVDKEQFMLEFYIGLTQASQDSRYSNDLIYKGKPFSVEFLWKGSADETLKALEKTIKKYQMMVFGDKQLDVKVDGTTLTVTAVTEYQRFKKVTLSKYAPDVNSYPYAGQYDVVHTLGDDKIKIKTAGKESFGTYDYILHNLRLPTFEATRFKSVTENEMPVIGAEYNQYTIHYCANRGNLGLNAVGDSVKSSTTHVFFVISTECDAFETALAKIGATSFTEKSGKAAGVNAYSTATPANTTTHVLED